MPLVTLLMGNLISYVTIQNINSIHPLTTGMLIGSENDQPVCLDAHVSLDSKDLGAAEMFFF